MIDGFFDILGRIAQEATEGSVDAILFFLGVIVFSVVLGLAAYLHIGGCLGPRIRRILEDLGVLDDPRKLRRRSLR